MPSLIDLRRRIRSVKSTQQVTKALKMVSAAKLRRAQDRVIAARPYALIFRQVLGDLAAAVAGDETADNPLLARREEKRILLVLFTSDQGRAGAFNTNLIKASQQFIADRAPGAVQLHLLGRKGRDFWRKHKGPVLAERTGISQKATYEDAVDIASEIVDRFAHEETDAVYLLCNEFKSILSQKLTVTRLLPVEFPTERTSTDFIFEQPPAAGRSQAGCPGADGIENDGHAASIRTMPSQHHGINLFRPKRSDVQHQRLGRGRHLLNFLLGMRHYR